MTAAKYEIIGFLVLFVTCCVGQNPTVRLQIIAPYVNLNLERAFNSVVGSSLNDIMTFREFSLLRRRATPEISFSYIRDGNPEEILEIFCNEVFTQNVNVILRLNFKDATMIEDYVMNIASSLGYPVISWNPNYPGAMQSIDDRRVLQLAPTIYHQCQSMIQLLERYNWTDFTIVTTKIPSKVDFIDCIKAMIVKTSVTSGYLVEERFTLQNIITLDIDEDYPYDVFEQNIKDGLQEVIGTDIRILLLHAHSDEAKDIMDYADEMGLVTQDYMWILTSSSVGSVFPSGSPPAMKARYPVGVLGIKYDDNDDERSEILKSSIKLWASGLQRFVRRRSSYSPKFACNDTSNDTFWGEGRYLYSDMFERGYGEPTTSFLDNGLIKNVKLIALNVGPPDITAGSRRPSNEWKKVGTFVPVQSGQDVLTRLEMEDIHWPGGSVFPPRGKPEKRFFKIATKEEHPYIIFTDPDPETEECGISAVPCLIQPRPEKHENVTVNGTVQSCCTGLCVELLMRLSERMKFDFLLYEVPDDQWGKENVTTGEWNGLIGEAVNGEADMLLTSLNMNTFRARAVSFSVPFMETGITILVSIRKGVVSPYAFLEPYDYLTWFLILVFCVHASGAAIFIFEWLSPGGLAEGKVHLRDNKFSLCRSFWLIWAMLFGAAVDVDVPKGVSSRFMANIWALFGLIFLASYTANLAAFMITLDDFYDLEGIQDIRLRNPNILDPPLKFATVTGSSTEDNIKTNYRLMHKYMQKFNQTSVPNAIKALKSNQIDAFIYDATVLEYNAGRDTFCRLLTVGKWYSMSGYAVGFPQGSELVKEVDKILLDMKKNGDIERMQSFWLSGACHAKKDKKSHSSKEIGILNFTSAFLLLATGVLIGFVLLLLEHLYFKSGRKCLKKCDKNDCCALVSLSMGKSLTFEQTIFEAIDIAKKHVCKNPMCEAKVWKSKHDLDLALIKIKRLQAELARRSDSKGYIELPSRDASKTDEYDKLGTDSASRDTKSDTNHVQEDSLKQNIPELNAEITPEAKFTEPAQEFAESDQTTDKSGGEEDSINQTVPDSDAKINPDAKPYEPAQLSVPLETEPITPETESELAQPDTEEKTESNQVETDHLKQTLSAPDDTLTSEPSGLVSQPQTERGQETDRSIPEHSQSGHEDSKETIS